MKQALLVFLGGGFGSVARYWLSVKFNNFESALPYGTMIANILGSLFIGLIFGYMVRTGNLSEKYSLMSRASSNVSVFFFLNSLK